MTKDKRAALKFIEGVPDGLDIVNTGSTFALYGFDYKYFGVRGFNFATAPQPLSYDYKILNHYKDKIKTNAVVVVVVCPFGFCVSDYKSEAAHYKYYYFLESDDIVNFSKPKRLFIKYCPVLLNPRRVITAIKAIAKKIIGRNKKQDADHEKHIAQTAKSRIESWKRDFCLQDTTDSEPDENLQNEFVKATESLRKILDLCIEKGFRPVIINMPACKEQSDEFSDEFIEKFYDVNVKRANTHNIPVIDYFRGSLFHDHSLFMNADCLNDKGREYFAKVFIEDLRKLGLWEDEIKR